MTTDTLTPWLLPAIPSHVERVTVNTDGWEVEFWYTDQFADGPEWVDMGGDYRSSKFAIAATVCEISNADEWGEWDCYPDDGGWIVFADNDGETGHPEGTGPSIADAIRDALKGSHQ